MLGILRVRLVGVTCDRGVCRFSSGTTGQLDFTSFF